MKHIKSSEMKRKSDNTTPIEKEDLILRDFEDEVDLDDSVVVVSELIFEILILEI